MIRILLLSAIIFPSFCYAQKDEEKLLKWSADRPLTWSDYEAEPDKNSDAAATTSTVLSVDYKMTNGGFGYKIKSYFSKTKSWGLYKTAYILSHEQGHFDIAEIFARKLNKLLSEYKFNKRNYQKDLGKIYEDVTKEKIEMQDDYDKQTNHSINKEEQAEWLKKIKELLKEYEVWSSY